MNKFALVGALLYTAVLLFVCVALGVDWVGRSTNGFALFSGQGYYYPEGIHEFCVVQNIQADCLLFKRFYSAGNAAIFFLFVAVLATLAAAILTFARAFNFNFLVEEKHEKAIFILSLTIISSVLLAWVFWSSLRFYNAAFTLGFGYFSALIAFVLSFFGFHYTSSGFQPNPSGGTS